MNNIDKIPEVYIGRMNPKYSWLQPHLYYYIDCNKIDRQLFRELGLSDRYKFANPVIRQQFLDSGRLLSLCFRRAYLGIQEVSDKNFRHIWKYVFRVGPAIAEATIQHQYIKQNRVIVGMVGQNKWTQITEVELIDSDLKYLYDRSAEIERHNVESLFQLHESK